MAAPSEFQASFDLALAATLEDLNIHFHLRDEQIAALKIDRIEEQRLQCQGRLERAEFRHRREQLTNEDKKALEDEMVMMNERIQTYEKELADLRGENRKNMMLSVALLAISALFYYTFVY